MIPFEDRGEGPAVTFLHGFALDRRMWSRQVQAIEATHRTLTVDLPGFGPRGAGDAGVHCPAEALLEVLDAAGVERTHLFAHSFGGAVAIDLALADPGRLLSLTLVDPLFLGRPSGIAAYPACAELSKRGLYDKARRAWIRGDLFASARRNSGVAQELRQMADDYGCGHWAGRITHRWLFEDPADRLRDLPLPTLVVNGEIDTPSFLAMAAEYAERLPRSSRRTVPGVGHMCNLEAPETFNEIVREVLEWPSPLGGPR